MGMGIIIDIMVHAPQPRMGRPVHNQLKLVLVYMTGGRHSHGILS